MTDKREPPTGDGVALGVPPHIRKRAAADLDELRQRDAKNCVAGTPRGVNITTWKVMSQISDALKNSCFEINGLRKCP